MSYSRNKRSKSKRTKRKTRRFNGSHKHTLENAASKKRMNGWICVEIAGTPRELGRAHGKLLHKEMAELFRRLKFYAPIELKRNYKTCVAFSRKHVLPKIAAEFPDIYEEICGIAEGAREHGVHVTVDELVMWNSYNTLYSHFVDAEPENGSNAGERCSAFIATGSAVRQGGIVMAHNSQYNYVLAQMSNIMMRVVPPTDGGSGAAFTMQTSPGLVSSRTDWFISDAGIVACETTIAAIRHKPRIIPQKGAPFFCRARRAMQYSQSIDDFIGHMRADSAGDYSCTWLIGDTRTGEIARFEDSVTTYSVARTTSGAYIGMNAALDPHVRAKDTFMNDGVDGLETSIGNRRARLEYLVLEKYYGALDARTAREIIADHYDSAENKTQKNSHSICKHVECDAGRAAGHADVRVPFYPRGTYDGKVFCGEVWARWGAACGRRFSVRKHVLAHPEFAKYENYMDDFGGHPWTQLKK